MEENKPLIPNEFKSVVGVAILAGGLIGGILGGLLFAPKAQPNEIILKLPIAPTGISLEEWSARVTNTTLIICKNEPGLCELDKATNTND